MSTYQIVLERIDEDIIFDHFRELFVPCFPIGIRKPGHECSMFIIVILGVVRTFTCFTFALFAATCTR